MAVGAYWGSSISTGQQLEMDAIQALLIYVGVADSARVRQPQRDLPPIPVPIQLVREVCDIRVAACALEFCMNGLLKLILIEI